MAAPGGGTSTLTPNTRDCVAHRLDEPSRVRRPLPRLGRRGSLVRHHLVRGLDDIDGTGCSPWRSAAEEAAALFRGPRVTGRVENVAGVDEPDLEM
jgi:hypothetical protein